MGSSSKSKKSNRVLLAQTRPLNESVMDFPRGWFLLTGSCAAPRIRNITCMLHRQSGQSQVIKRRFKLAS